MAFICRLLTAAWILAGFPLVLPAQAQTTTPISLDLTVDYVQGTTVITYTGSGTVAPFGSVTFLGVQTFTPTSSELSVTITFANGDTLQADSKLVKGSSVSFTITGGTGAFINATGSFTVQTGSISGTSGSFQASGAGSITTQDTSTGTFSVSPSALTFSFLQGGQSSSQQIALNNGTTAPVAVSATTSGESWLSVSPANGVVPLLQIASVSLTVNPAGLAPGTYTATVTVSAVGQQFPVSINVTVNAAPQALALSQTSLRFQVAAGASAPPSQSIEVLNQGTGSLNWSASASTLIGNWLSVTPASGTSGNSATVAIDPSNLQPGDYYGLVQFTSDGAVNSPQSAVVVLNILPAATIVATVEPTGLIFVAPQGGAPAPQTVTVVNSSNQAVAVSATAASQQNGLFAPNLSSAMVSSGQPAEFLVTPNLSGLTPAVYTGILQFQFADGSIQDVTVLVIVTQPASSVASRSSMRDVAESSACMPKQLFPVSTALGQNFNTTAAWPIGLQIHVVDDCGSPMGPGDVVASFSTGDPPLALTSLGSGLWSGTWQPRFTAASASVVITIPAQSAQPAITGTLQINGTLHPNQTTPAIFNAGVVSTASFAPNAPLAP